MKVHIFLIISLLGLGFQASAKVQTCDGNLSDQVSYLEHVSRGEFSAEILLVTKPELLASLERRAKLVIDFVDFVKGSYSKNPVIRDALPEVLEQASSRIANATSLIISMSEIAGSGSTSRLNLFAARLKSELGTVSDVNYLAGLYQVASHKVQALSYYRKKGLLTAAQIARIRREHSHNRAGNAMAIQQRYVATIFQRLVESYEAAGRNVIVRHDDAIADLVFSLQRFLSSGDRAELANWQK